MKKIQGVYKITNKITGDFYIGSSKNIEKRWINHKSPSRWKQRPNSRMYKDMAQYGLTNFTFEIVEETDNLHEREQYFIDLLKPSYNILRANGRDIERYREYNLKFTKEYNNKLCLYQGEILHLNTLSSRFCKQGISHPSLEAKKYLIDQ